MSSSLAGVSPRRFLVLLGLWGWTLQASAGAQNETRPSATGHEPGLAEREGVDDQTMSLSVHGRVVDQDGVPHEGALVVSSAGGQAITDARGEYCLEAEVPLDAEGVQLTATAARSGMTQVASGWVAVTGSSATRAGTLFLDGVVCCQAGWEPTFGPHPGMNAAVRVLAVLDDGSGPALYAGGDFTSARGVAANHVAKRTGSSWSALGDGVNGLVRALTVLDLGGGPSLYAGGDFTMAGGVAANHIARWDGTAWSALDTGLDGVVQALAVFDDGSGPRLYAGGDFSIAGGRLAPGIASWDGTRWSAVGSGMSGTQGHSVQALLVADDGNGPALYAGGAFDTPASNVAKWDGSSWSGLGAGVGSCFIECNYVSALAVFDDGGGPALYAGGFFSQAGGGAASNIARWDAGGSSWSPLGSGVPSGGSVRALAAFDVGNGPMLCAGGTFQVAGGVSASAIASWDGSSWSALGSGMNNALQGSPQVSTLTVFDGGDGPTLYAGGDFDTAGGKSASGFAKWDGSSWSGDDEPGRGLNRPVFASTVFDDGSGPALFAGGLFTMAGGVEANYVAKWNGSSWSALGQGLNNWVAALTVFDDGSGPALYAAGDFTSAGGVVAGYVARWDGSSWSAVGSGMTSSVSALAVFDDGSGPQLYAGGLFLFAGGVSARRVARWDGSSWSALGSGMDGGVDALTVFDDGNGQALYAGGTFSTSGGVTTNRIARWDGSSWSALGGGVPGGYVAALTTFDDGRGPALYVGGYTFTTAGGVPASRIAKWDGTSWSGLGSGMNDAVLALTTHDDGSGQALYAGGRFTTAGGVTASRIAKWDGSSWSALGSGMNGHVHALTAHDEDSGAALFAGGDFFRAPDSGDSYLARWRCIDTSPPAISCPSAVFVLDEPTPWARRVSDGAIGAGPEGELVSFVVTAVDPCGPAPSVVCTPPSGSFFPRGKTVVTCTASDEAGNQATCSFPVFVYVLRRARER